MLKSTMLPLKSWFFPAWKAINLKHKFREGKICKTKHHLVSQSSVSALDMSRTLGGSEKFTLSFTVEVAAALIPFCPLFPFGIRPKLTPEKWGRETDGRMNKNKLSYPPSHGREGRIRGGNLHGADGRECLTPLQRRTQV